MEAPVSNEHQQVRTDSDRLLGALDELKRMERRKRDEEFSTPEFHELADDVEDQAREVFRIASVEAADGEDAPKSSASINDVQPSD
jgi:hypothetical protein